MVVWLSYEFLTFTDQARRGLGLPILFHQMIQEGFAEVALSLDNFSESILAWGNGSFRFFSDPLQPNRTCIVTTPRVPFLPGFSELRTGKSVSSRHVAASVAAIRLLRHRTVAATGMIIDELFQALAAQGFQDIIPHTFALRLLLKQITQHRVSGHWQQEQGFCIKAQPLVFQA